MASVDRRIVDMQFDNKQFERGIRQSTDSLKEFEKQLDFKNSGKSLSDLERSMNKFSLEKMAQSIDTISSRFTTMGMIGKRVLDNMVDSAYRAGERLVRSLSIDQLNAGMSKYEQKAASVQTIMNSTGKSMEQVSGYLDKLMWFSDETSYGFSDMTAALAQMTSSGGDIDSLIPLITGVANATAFAGKGAAEFSRVMYNLNQSYGMGNLQYMDWKSVELAGVGSKQLKQILIDTAVSMGKIKEGEITLANFGETLKDKWADKGVMEQGFGKFAEFSEAVRLAVENDEYATAAKAIEALADKYEVTSVEAFKAAQTAKTFTEAIEATKDAVSSGWMRTFELIFGNYEEAKALWTGLTNELWEVFASGAEDRNQLLFDWKQLGGREDLIRGLATLYNSIKVIVDQIKGAWSDVFKPIDAEGLAGISKKFKNFSRSIFMWLHADAGDGESRLQKIGNIFKGFFSILKVGVDILSAVADKIKKVLLAVVPGGLDTLLKFFSDIGKSITEFAENTDIKAVVDKVFGQIGAILTPVINTITKYAGIIWNTISDLFGIGKDKEKKIDPDRVSWAEDLKRIYGDVVKVLGPIISTISRYATLIWNTIADLFGFGPKQATDKAVKGQIERESFAPKILSFFGPIGTTLAPIIDTISNYATIVWNTISDLFGWGDKEKKTADPNRVSLAQKIQDFFGGAGTVLGPIFSGIGEFAKKIPGFLSNIGTFVGGLFTYLKTSDRVKGWWESIKQFFGPVISYLGDVWSKISGFFSNLFGIGTKKNIKTIKRMGSGSSGVSGGSGPPEAIQVLQERFSTPEGIREYFDGLIDSVKKWATNFGKAIGDKWREIKTNIVNIFKSKEDGGVDDKNSSSLLDKIAPFLEKVGGVVKAIWEFAKTWWMWIAAGVIIFKVANFMNNVGIAYKLMQKRKLVRDGGGVSDSMAKFALSIVGIAGSIYLLTTIEPAKLWTAVGIIGAIIAVMFVIERAGRKKLTGNQKSTASMGNAMLAMAGSLVLVVYAIKMVMEVLEGINKDNWGIALGAVAIVGGILAALVFLSKRMSGMNIKGNKHGWKSILAIAASVLIVVQALKPLAKISPEGLVKMAAGLLVIALVFRSLIKAGQPIGKHGVAPKSSNVKGMVGLAIGIAILVHALRPIAKMKPNDLKKIGLVLAAITLVMYVLSRASKDMKGGMNTAAPLLAMAGMLWVLGDTLRKVKDVDWQKIIAFSAGVATIVLSLGASMALAKNSNLSSGAGMLLGLIGAGGIIWLLGDALGKLPNVSTDKILTFAGAVAVITGTGALGSGLLGLIGGVESLLGGGALLAASLGVVGIVYFLAEALAKIPENVSENKIAIFVAGVGALVGVGAASAGLLGLVGPLAIVGALATGISVASIALLVNELGSALAKIPANVSDSTIATFVAGVGSLVGVGAGSAGLLGLVGPLAFIGAVATGISVASIALLVNEIGSALETIGKYDISTEKIEAFTNGIALITGVNGISTAINSFSVFGGFNSVLSSLGLEVVIDSLGRALTSIADIDVDKITAFTTGVALITQPKSQGGLEGILDFLLPFKGINDYNEYSGLSVLIATLGKAFVDVKKESVTEADMKAFTDSVDRIISMIDGVEEKSFGERLSNFVVGTSVDHFAGEMASFAEGITALNTAMMGIKLPFRFYISSLFAVASARAISKFLDDLAATKIGEVGEDNAARKFASYTLADDLTNFSTGLTEVSAALKTTQGLDLKTLTTAALGSVEEIVSFLSTMKEDKEGKYTILDEHVTWFGKMWGKTTTTDKLKEHLDSFAEGIRNVTDAMTGIKLPVRFYISSFFAVASARAITKFLDDLAATKIGEVGEDNAARDFVSYKLSDDLTNFSTGLTDVSAALKTTQGLDLKTLTTDALGAVEDIVSFLSTMKEDKEGKYTILDEHVTWFGKIWGQTTTTDKLKEHLDSFAEGINKVIEPFNKIVVGDFEKKATSATTAAETIAGFLSGMHTNEDMQKLMGPYDLLLSSTTFFNEMGILGGSLKTFGDNTKGIDLNRFTTLVGAVSQFTADLTALATATKDSSEVEELVSGMTSLVGDISTGISNASTEFNITWFTLLNGALDYIDENVAIDYEGLGRNLISAIERGLTGEGEDTVNPIKSGLTGVLNETVKAGKKEETSFRGVGVNLARGLANGMKGSRDFVLTAARELARSVLLAMKQEMDMESPSKETELIGYFTVAGFAGGIRNNSKLPIAAAKDMAGAVLQASRDVLGIASKSKELQADGRWVAVGLEDGIISNADRPVSAAEKMAEEVAEKAADAAANVTAEVEKANNGVLDNISNAVSNLTSTIGGGLDSLKEKGATLMSSLFDGSAIEGFGQEFQDTLDMLNFEDSFLPDWLKPILGLGDDDKPTDKPPVKSGINVSKTTAEVQQLCGTVGQGQSQMQNLANLGNQMEDLVKNVANMRVVMNSGALVGQIVTDIDRQLGTMTTSAGRG